MQIAISLGFGAAGPGGAGEAPPEMSPTLPATLPAALSAALSARVAADSAWSWHIQKTAVFDAARGRIYAGAVSFKGATGTAGSQWILEFDAADGAFLGRHLVHAGFAADDHNAPALYLLGGRLIVGCCGHGDSAGVRMYRAASSDPATLGPATVLDSDGESTTYVQFWEIGGTLYAGTRATGNHWRVWRNAAGGDPAQWGDNHLLLNSASQCYMAARATPAGVAMVLWDHPTGGAEAGVIGLVEIADPMAAPTITTTAAPALFAPPAGTSSRVLSVNDDCTQIAYGRFTLGEEPCSYHLARLTGSDRANPAHWTHEALGITTQRAYYPDSAYVAGVELAGAGAEASALWLGYCSPTIYENRLEYWSRPGPQAAWERVVVAEGDRQMIRPIVPWGAPAGMALVAQIMAYASFTDLEADALLIPEPVPQAFFPNLRWPGQPLCRDRFATPGALAGRAADLGGSWTVLSGAPAVTAGALHGSGSAEEVALLGPALSGDVTAACLVQVAGTTGSGYLVLRAAADGGDMLMARYNVQAQAWQLYARVAGSASLLGSSAAAMAAGHVARLVLTLSGTDCRLLVNDSVRITAPLPAALQGAGHVGVRFLGGGAAEGVHLRQLGVSAPEAPA